MKPETLISYTTVQRWFRQLRKKSADIHNGHIPEGTRRLALSSLKAYCEYTGMTPDQIIEDARRCLRDTGSIDKHNDLLDGFWDSYPSKTTAGVYFNYIRSFYRSNSITLTTRMPQIPKIRQVERLPTNEEIRRICDVAPLKHASWILANSYMGLRVSTITKLQVADFNTENWIREQPLYPVMIRQNIQKRGSSTYTIWIGRDAKNKLESYFKKEGFKPEDKPWNLKPTTLIYAFKKYAYRAGVIDAPNGFHNHHGKVPRGTSQLRPHSLRKRLQTILESVGTPQNWVDHMLGHKPRGADAPSYSKPRDEQLYEWYLKALPKLQIYGTPQPASQVELRKQMILDMLKLLPNINEEKLKGIQNLLQKARTQKELNEKLYNIMDYIKQREAVQNKP